jgi:putative transcriptional regulator
MSKLGDDILQGLKEALAHAEGKDVPGMRVHHIDLEKIDARAIRRKLKLTQDKMAAYLGTSVSGYRKWEQGQRRPSGAARTLLQVMEKEPEAVLRALVAR